MFWTCPVSVKGMTRMTTSVNFGPPRCVCVRRLGAINKCSWKKAIPKRSQHYVDSALLPFQRSNDAFQIGNVGASPHHLQNNEMHRRPFSLSMFRKEMRRGQGSVRGPVEERPNASLRLPESTLQRRQARDRQIPAPLRDKHLPLLSPDRQRN